MYRGFIIYQTNVYISCYKNTGNFANPNLAGISAQAL